MEKSFRDILSQLLEENGTESPSEKPQFSSEIPSDFAASLGGWRPSQRENPSAQRVLRYKSQVPKGDSPSEEPTPTPAVAPPPPSPSPAAETLLTLEELDRDSRIMVGILLDLGAAELQSGVSLSRVKKAYRRLAKKFHPDRLSPSASSQQKDSAKTAFFRLQKAYDYLSESLVRGEDTLAA